MLFSWGPIILANSCTFTDGDLSRSLVAAFLHLSQETGLGACHGFQRSPACFGLHKSKNTKENAHLWNSHSYIERDLESIVSCCLIFCFENSGLGRKTQDCMVLTKDMGLETNTT